METKIGRQASPRKQRSARDVVGAVRPVAERFAAVHGLVVWEVRFVREAGRETLRVACDKVGGVGSDELALYADDLSRELDHSDVVPGEARYVLEVTSPGAERKLAAPEHYEICVGRNARLVLRDGRAVEGVIAEPTEKAAEIETEDGPVRVLFADIARAQLVVPPIGGSSTNRRRLS